MAYLLDANVFIQAKNLHYGMDFCPAFWDWLIAANAAGRVFSIEKVGDEVEAGGDSLSAWSKERGSGFFLKPDAALLPALGSVSAWAAGQGYEPAAVNTFLQIADYYLVAHALAHEHTVVYSRSPISVDQEDQNPQRVHRCEREVHEPIRNASSGARALRSGASRLG